MWESFVIAAGWGALVLVSVTVSEEMAKSRKRDVELWLLLSALFGPLALLTLRFLGKAPERTAQDKRREVQVASLVSVAIFLGLVLLMAVPFVRACFRI
jgi:hypothetical protein